MWVDFQFGRFRYGQSLWSIWISEYLGPVGLGRFIGTSGLWYWADKWSSVTWVDISVPFFCSVTLLGWVGIFVTQGVFYQSFEIIIMIIYLVMINLMTRWIIMQCSSILRIFTQQIMTKHSIHFFSCIQFIHLLFYYNQLFQYLLTIDSTNFYCMNNDFVPSESTVAELWCNYCLA